MERLKHKIEKEINATEDNLRIYYIHGSREECVEIFGRDGYVDYEDALII